MFRLCFSELHKVESSTLYSVLTRLAFVYKQRSNRKEVEKLDQKVLEERERKLWSEHPLMLPSTFNLAWTFASSELMGGSKRSRITRDRQMVHILGPNHPQLHLNPQTAMEVQGSRNTQWVSFNSSKKVVASDHTFTLGYMGNLPSTYWGLGRFKDARFSVSNVTTQGLAGT